MEFLNEVAVVRTGLVFVHLLAVLIATAGICFADYSLLAGQRIDTKLLTAASRLVTVALGMLWATGSTIIWFDTGFDLAAIASNGKLLAKLTVALALTLNGAA